MNIKGARRGYIRPVDRADMRDRPGYQPAVIHLGEIGRVNRDLACEGDRGGGSTVFEVETLTYGKRGYLCDR